MATERRFNRIQHRGLTAGRPFAAGTLLAIAMLSFATPAAAWVDLDNDLMRDSWEITNGLNPDDGADALLDPDGDGLSNLEEHDAYTDPNNRDSDADWVIDGAEVNIHSTNPNSVDTDGDGVTDFGELFAGTPAGTYNIDADNDGMPAPWELANGFDPDNPADALTNADTDGLNNLQEYQNETDPRNADSDADWLRDDIEVNTYFSNPNDIDSDGDGLLDFNEAYLGLSPIQKDTDGDGMEDKWELDNGLDPLDPADATADADADGLDNLGEFQFDTDPNYRDSDGDWLPDGTEVYVSGTDPQNPDTDADGELDFSELWGGTDPLLFWNLTDTDGDGISDDWEAANELDAGNGADGNADADGDTFSNYEEFRLGSNPNDSSSTPQILQSYSESFESTPVGNAWQSTAAGDDRRWDRYCKTGSDGSCSLGAGAAGSSGSWYSRTAAGSLSFDYRVAANAALNVYVDGALVLAAGPTAGWQSQSVPVTGGIHEVLFEQTAGNPRDSLIDNVQFASTNVGLATRPQNLTCLAPPVVPVPVDVEVTFPYPEAEAVGDFYKVTKVLQAPGDNSRWYLLEQEGLIKYFDIDDPDNVVTWLDFTGNIKFDGEMGLLGLAFDPDYPNTPEVYVTYTGYPDPVLEEDPEFRLSRIILDDTEQPQNTTEEILLRQDQDTIYHHGGDLRFGDDNMLWVSTGDDSKATEAQDTDSTYGAILRLDVRGVGYPLPGYNIPPGNAFPTPPGDPGYRCGDEIVNSNNCPEIWAWGFRNPWRWSFDPVDSNKLWVGDVGYNDWEEVSLVEAGKNYGWGCFEGNTVNVLSNKPCIGPFEPPVFDYSHNGSNAAVIGGFVYRGSAMPGLVGKYIFGDVMTGRIYALTPDGNGGYSDEILLTTSGGITGFAEGPGNEIYFSRWIPGRIGKLVPGDDAPEPDDGDNVPENLVDTGCVDPADPTQPAAGLVPYDVRAKLWSDGADKHRAMAIPDGTQVTVDADGDFIYPVGSVLYKDFWLNNKIIETRLLMKRQDGSDAKWEGFSYEWNAEQTEATLTSGKTTTIDGQEWTFPNQVQCRNCHTEAANHALGPEVVQLNHDIVYEQSGNTANQLETLEAIDYLSAPLGDVDGLSTMPDPFDVNADLGDRARAYLHANCAGCHRPGSVVPSPMDFRYDTPLDSIAACDEPPGLGDLGIGPSARLIAPGSAADSVIVKRMDERTGEQMPPLGTAIVDDDAILLISNWIDSLSGCTP